MKSDFRSESFERKLKAILFVYNLMTGCSKKNRKMLLNIRNKETHLTFNSGLVLISLRTTRPRTGRTTSVSDRGTGTCFLTSNSLVTWLFKNPDTSHIETFIWKKRKKIKLIYWYFTYPHRTQKDTKPGPRLLQTPISTNPALTLKPLKVTNI